MKYAIINNVKYRVNFGNKFTTFRALKSRRCFAVENSIRVKDLPAILKEAENGKRN